MTVFLGADHAGYELKQHLQDALLASGYEVIDKGAYEYDKTDDYPPLCAAVAQAVHDNPDTDKGIVIGGSGQGEAMVCNRFLGVRAAVYYGQTPEIITLSRTHNDANILSLGARFLSQEEAREAVHTWLETTFSEDTRHVRRITQIEQLFS